MKLSVILPVFEEKGNIGPLVKKVKEVIAEDVEIIVVDDGSADGTVDEIDLKLAKVLRHPHNRGKGAAMRTGIKEAQGEIIMFIDSDGQDDPSEIPILIKAISEGADFVIGSRFLGHLGKDAITGINFIGNKILTFLINVLFKVYITDSQASFKCFKADKLKNLPLESDRYEIETEMLIRSIIRGYKIKEIPIHRYQRKYGKSHLYEVPLGKLKFALRFIKTIIKGYFIWGRPSQ